MVGEVKLLAVTTPFTMRMLVPVPFRSITFCAVVDVETFAQNATDLTDEETEPTVVEAVSPSNLIAWPILPGVVVALVVLVFLYVPEIAFPLSSVIAPVLTLTFVLSKEY